MDKTKPNEALSGRPIGKKIVAKMKRHRRGKVIDIKDWIDGRTTAEELHKEIVAQKELASLDPAFAAYVYPQIQVSVMSEQLTALKEMAIWRYRLQGRRSVHAGRTADESADQVLLHVLGALRCVRRSGRRDYRHYNS